MHCKGKLLKTPQSILLSMATIYRYIPFAPGQGWGYGLGQGVSPTKWSDASVSLPAQNPHLAQQMCGQVEVLLVGSPYIMSDGWSIQLSVTPHTSGSPGFQKAFLKPYMEEPRDLTWHLLYASHGGELLLLVISCCFLRELDFILHIANSHWNLLFH